MEFFNTNCPAAIKNKILKKRKKPEDFYKLGYMSCKFFYLYEQRFTLPGAFGAE